VIELQAHCPPGGGIARLRAAYRSPTDASRRPFFSVIDPSWPHPAGASTLRHVVGLDGWHEPEVQSGNWERAVDGYGSRNRA
jgi:hypothetical protein